MSDLKKPLLAKKTRVLTGITDESEEKERGIEIRKWEEEEITTTNIEAFKTFQKDFKKTGFLTETGTSTLPNFYNYVVSNLGSSKLFADGQWTYTHHTYEVYGCCNTNCGYYLVSGARDMYINVVAQYEMKLRHRWKAHESTIMRVRILKDDSKIFSCSFDKSIRIWNTNKSGQWETEPTLEKKLEGHDGWVYDIALSPDETKLLSVSVDKKGIIWDWVAGTQLLTLEKGSGLDAPGHTEVIRCCCWSEDGTKAITGGQDAMIIVWDAVTGSVIHQLEGHTTYVLSLTNKGNTLASGSTDKTIREWDLEKGTLENTILYHTKNVETLSFLPGAGRKVLSGSLDQTIRMFDLDTGLQDYIIEGHTGGVYCAVFSPDKRFVVSGSADKSTKLTKIETDKLEQNRRGFHTGLIWHCDFSADNKWYMTAAADMQIIVWEYYTYNVKYRLKGHTSHVTTSHFMPDNAHVFSTSYDGSCRIWDMTTEAEISKIELGKTCWYADCNPSQTKLAVASATWKIHLYDITNLEKPTEIRTFDGHTYDVLCVQFDKEENLLSGSSDSKIRYWDGNTGECKREIFGHDSIIYHIRFLHGDRICSSSMDTTVRIWNYKTGACENILRAHTHPVPALAVTPDKKLIISGGQDSMLNIWNAETGLLEHRWRGHRAWVRSITIDVNGERFISVSDDAMVKVWKLSNILFNMAAFLKPGVLEDVNEVKTIIKGNPLAITQGLYRSDFTIIHALAETGNVAALKACYKAKRHFPAGLVPWKIDMSGRTPMHYAFERRHFPAVDFFLQLLQDYPARVCDSINDIMPDILILGFSNIAEFIDSRLMAPMSCRDGSGPLKVPKLTTHDEDVVLRGSERPHLDRDGYNEMAPYDKEKLDSCRPLDLSCLYVPNIMDPEYIDAICDSDDPALFTSEGIQRVFEFKWATYAKKEYLKEFIGFVVFLLCFCAMTISWAHGWGFVFVTIIPVSILALFHISHEIKQCLTSDVLMDYFTDVWNVFDLIVLTTTIGGCAMILIQEIASLHDDDTMNFVLSKWLSFNALFFWFRLIAYLRPFRQIGAMIRIILQMIVDCLYFLLLLILALVGFAHAFYLATETDRPTPLVSLANIYNLILGNFDSPGGDPVTWILFILATFILMIIMLNMLIALMADTYVHIQEAAEGNAYLEWAKMMNEIDHVLGPERVREMMPKYLFIATERKVKAIDEEAEEKAAAEAAKAQKKPKAKKAKKNATADQIEKLTTLVMELKEEIAAKDE